MEDLYKILGVEKTATADQIKKAYRELAMKYHPDRNPGDAVAEEMFKKISSAYSVLGDETKRKQYDMYGSTDSTNTTYSGNYQGNWQGYGGYYQGNPFEEWFKNSQNYNRNSQYEYDNSNKKYEEPTKLKALGKLVSSVVSIIIGFFFLRFSFILLPIGPILCIMAIANGFSGALRAVKFILTPKK